MQGNVRFEVTPEDAGCWIDGHWGQYGAARLVELAAGLGYDDVEDIATADRILASMGPAEDVAKPEDWDRIVDAAEAAEAFLNDRAPEGFVFGWEDGEFFLSPLEDDPMEA